MIYLRIMSQIPSSSGSLFIAIRRNSIYFSGARHIFVSHVTENITTKVALYFVDLLHQKIFRMLR